MNPIYCKYSNDRAERFQIKTTIWKEEDGTRFVWKSRWKEAAGQHVDKIYAHYLQMKDSFAKDGVFIPNRCEKTKDGVKLEFIEGETFEQYLDSLYLSGRYAELVGEIKKYKDVLYSLPDNIPFTYTKEFDEVFGKETQFSNCMSLKISNIDLIFCNIIPQGKWVIIDYEWIFDFPVPIDFIIYRAVHYYLYGSTKRNDLLDFHIFKLLGISEEDQRIYGVMEQKFQEYVAGEKCTMSVLKSTMLKGYLDARTEMQDVRTDFVQFYMDNGAGYSEENSLKYTYSYSDQEIKAMVCLPEDVVSLRLDPASAPVMVKGLVITVDGEKVQPDRTNGLEVDGGTYIFRGQDPQVLLFNVRGKKEITVHFSAVSLLGSKSEEMILMAGIMEELQKKYGDTERKRAHLIKEKEEYERQCREMSQYIEDMQNRLVWRIGSKIKRIFKGKG